MSTGPELWGTAQAAAYLGVTRARIQQLHKAYPDRLKPVFVARITRRKWWLADDWRAFATLHRPAGRHRHNNQEQQ